MAACKVFSFVRSYMQREILCICVCLDWLGAGINKSSPLGQQANRSLLARARIKPERNFKVGYVASQDFRRRGVCT